jgi:hypothetical protein
MSWRWVANAVKRVTTSSEETSGHLHDCKGLKKHIDSSIFDSRKRLSRIVRTASVLGKDGNLSFFAVGNTPEERACSKKVLKYILRNLH